MAMRELYREFVAAGACALLLLVPSVALGQMTYSVGGAVSLPVGELSDRGLSKSMGWHVPLHEFPTEARTGMHLQGSIGYEFSSLPIGLRADLLFQNFPAVEREPGVNVSLGGEWYRQLGVVLNATYRFARGAVQPYGLVGAAWLREWHGDRTHYPQKQASVPLHAGAGIDIPFLGIVGFLEVRYMNLLGSGEDMVFQSVPVTVGVRF